MLSYDNQLWSFVNILAWGTLTVTLTVMQRLYMDLNWAGYVIERALSAITIYVHFLVLIKFVVNELVSASFICWVVSQEVVKTV